MSLLQAFFLGLLQGLTEFLPVSSSGHLVLAQELLGFFQPPVFFDIVLHIGTLLATFVFFRKEIVGIIKSLQTKLMTGKNTFFWPVIPAVIIGTIPALIVGLFLNSYLENIFGSVLLVSISLLTTAGLLFSTNLVKQTKIKLNNISLKDAFFIGIFQSLAILPGISRSGSTIVAGLWRKLDRKTAFRFSFLLSIPAIIGALVLQLKDFQMIDIGQPVSVIVGFLTAALFGYLSLIWLNKIVVEKKLSYFGYYCLALGLIALFFAA